MIKKYETVIVDQLPSKDEMRDGVIYFTEKGQRSSHLCPCNCKEEVLLSHYRGGWKYLIEKNGEITISTIIQNKDCKTYYKVKNGYIFCE